MQFSYSGNPNASNLDKVRFLLQDTDSSDVMLSDEEICYLIETYQDVQRAALEACYVLIAKFAKYVDESEGRQSVQASQLQQNYRNLAQELENKCATSTSIFVGGVSESDYLNNKYNSENVKPQFNDQNGDNKRAWRGDDN